MNGGVKMKGRLMERLRGLILNLRKFKKCFKSKEKRKSAKSQTNLKKGTYRVQRYLRDAS